MFLIRSHRRTTANGVTFAIIALSLLCVAKPTLSETPITILVWPKTPKDVSAAEQMDALAQHVAKTVANAYPARFVVRREPDLESVRTALAQAQELLREDKTGRRAPELLELATAAYQAARNELESVSASDLAEIFRIMGIASYLNGQEQLAREYASAYFHLSPDSTDSNWSEFPEIRALALTVQTEGKTRPPGRLKLETVPSGAVVQIDGKGRGITPLTVDVGNGLHWVQFAAEGYYPKAWIAEAKSAELQTLKLTLQSHPSRTRYESALDAVKKAISSDTNPAIVANAGRDITELAKSTAVLAILVESDKDKYGVSGVFVTSAGNIIRFERVLVKDATVLSEFGSLISSILQPN